MSRSSVAWKPSSAASSFAPALRRVADAPFLLAIRDAFPWAFGALLAAFAVLAFVVPIARALLPAFGVMSVALGVALPLAYARRARCEAVSLVSASLLAFALILPKPLAGGAVSYLQTLGTTGIFLAILACGVAAAGVALARSAWGAFASVALCATLVLGLHADVSQLVASALEPLGTLGDSLPALVAIVAAQMLLWSIGVHGPAMLSAIVTPVYLTLQMQNTAAYAAHEPLPHVVVASLWLFVFPGGSGATLPLAALFAVSRVARLRRLGRLTILPALANVNEPLVFGTPLVLNPYLAIPFFATPIVLAIVTYAAIVLGFVARPAFYVPAAIPAPISAYLATLDPRAPLLIVLNLLLATLLYWPFVRAYERKSAAA